MEFHALSMIYFSDYIQNLEDCSEINIITSGSIVKLVWNDPLNSIYGLVNGCSNI